ncbi:Dyp-type peroxidase [Roseomonas elaeocarpi]|uniref:Dyp-type peroxidase n=1 Tax=Roseomonas elaeocarpi TaxID=907779 RepID=A0ABV6JZJ7_9PROT
MSPTERGMSYREENEMPQDAPIAKGVADILATPIRWHDAKHDPNLNVMLCDLQANILKGHGRDHTGHVFVSFHGMTPAAIADVLRGLAPRVKTALEQLTSTEHYKMTGEDGGTVICVFLARGAYGKLQLPAMRRPKDPAFVAGMRARGQLPKLQFVGIPGGLDGLNDPPQSQWGTGWGDEMPEPDAMILVAGDTTDQVTQGLQEVEALLNGTGASILTVERGEAQRRRQPGGNPKGEGLEHFGYVDGRSQPLFLQEDIAAETGMRWNPAFPPSQFVVPDPGGRSPLACGSYFVFRKLEQNVKKFKAQEDELAGLLNLPAKDRERAGAMVVGRWEDGTPVVGPSDAPVAGMPMNDFNYGEDAEGLRCPFRAHIRKTNPRSPEPKPGDPAPPPGLPAERSRIMARRGITYGQRQPRPDGADFPEDDLPERDVGLLFMAYMSNITEQFEFTQAGWANNSNFPTGNAGVDPVLGQRPNPAAPPNTHWQDGTVAGGRTGHEAQFDFKTSVTLLGGDYFFAPSVGFLKNPI